MDLTPYRHTDDITIAAPPEAVYALISDITRMGEWSPECTGGTWVDDSHEWFQGANERDGRTWETRCRVDVAEPGREFTFTNCGFDGTVNLVRWSYTMTPDGDGTVLRESWEVLDDYPVFMNSINADMDVAGYLDGQRPAVMSGMAATLAALAQAFRA